MRRPLLLLVILPFWTSYLLRVTSWTTILGQKGVLNRFLEAIGLIHQPLSFLLYNRPAVILVLDLPVLPVRRADAVRDARAV